MSPLPLTLHGRDLAAMRQRAMRARRIEVTSRGRHRINLWLPLTPFFWLLSPLAFLLAPLLLLAPPMWRVNPYLAVFTIGRVLTSLRGTEVDVDAHDARIRLRIF